MRNCQKSNLIHEIMIVSLDLELFFSLIIVKYQIHTLDFDKTVDMFCNSFTHLEMFSMNLEELGNGSPQVAHCFSTEPFPKAHSVRVGGNPRAKE